MMGLVVGSIYWQIADAAFVSKFSLFFVIIVQSFFFNMVRMFSVKPGYRCARHNK